MNNAFDAVLSSLPKPGGNGYHTAILGAANVGIRCGYDPHAVAAEIRAHTHTGGRRVPDSEIMAAVNKAAKGSSGTSGRSRVGHLHNPRPVKTFDECAFMQARLQESNGVSEVDVWQASPIRVDWSEKQDAVELLQRLYDPGDMLFLGDQYGTKVKPVGQWLADFKGGEPIPPHIIPNPLTGMEGTTKDGKPSFRADSCVKSFRFAVAEFDGMSREDQIRFWWSVNLPVCALIDSGGKSLHAWIRIDDVNNAEQWSDLVEDKLFGRYLIPFGCDSACRNEARLSRMPGHYRTEKQRWQRILYLSPEGRRVNP